MITLAIIQTAVGFLNFITVPLGSVTTLPLGMDTALLTAMQYFRAIMAIFPPFGVLFTAFSWYLGFRVTLLTLRFFRIIR